MSSSSLLCFERINAVKICNGITFDFYLGLPHTVDLEIFVLYNFRVLNFRVKLFSWSRIPMKIFDGSTFPGSVTWNKTTHAKSTDSLHAVFVAIM